MKLAVAGASGRIGSAMIAALTRAGHDHVALGRHDVVSGLPDSLVPARLAGAAALINCAGAQEGTPDDLELSNVTVATRLAEFAVSAGVGRFIHISSLVVQSSAAGSSRYAVAKLRAERALAHCLAGTSTRLTLVRPGWVVSDSPHVAAQIAPRDGRQVLVEDFQIAMIVADDLARAVITGIDSPVDVLTAATDTASAADVIRSVLDLWPAPVRTVTVSLARAQLLTTSMKLLPLPDGLTGEILLCRGQLGTWAPWQESVRRSVVNYLALA